MSIVKSIELRFLNELLLARVGLKYYLGQTASARIRFLLSLCGCGFNSYQRPIAIIINREKELAKNTQNFALLILKIVQTRSKSAQMKTLGVKHKVPHSKKKIHKIVGFPKKCLIGKFHDMLSFPCSSCSNESRFFP